MSILSNNHLLWRDKESILLEILRRRCIKKKKKNQLWGLSWDHTLFFIPKLRSHTILSTQAQISASTLSGSHHQQLQIYGIWCFWPHSVLHSCTQTHKLMIKKIKIRNWTQKKNLDKQHAEGDLVNALPWCGFETCHISGIPSLD